MARPSAAWAALTLAKAWRRDRLPRPESGSGYPERVRAAIRDFDDDPQPVPPTVQAAVLAASRFKVAAEEAAAAVEMGDLIGWQSAYDQMTIALKDVQKTLPDARHAAPKKKRRRRPSRGRFAA